MKNESNSFLYVNVVAPFRFKFRPGLKSRLLYLQSAIFGLVRLVSVSFLLTFIDGSKQVEWQKERTLLRSPSKSAMDFGVLYDLLTFFSVYPNIHSNVFIQ